MTTQTDEGFGQRLTPSGIAFDVKRSIKGRVKKALKKRASRAIRRKLSNDPKNVARRKKRASEEAELTHEERLDELLATLYTVNRVRKHYRRGRAIQRNRQARKKRKLSTDPKNVERRKKRGSRR